MVESVLSSKSVSQWKFEDKFEDRQATLPSCTWKETEDAFFPWSIQKYWFLDWSVWTVFQSSFELEKLSVPLFCSELFPAWDSWSCRELSLRIKGLSCISCSDIPEFWWITSAGVGPPQRAGPARRGELRRKTFLRIRLTWSFEESEKRFWNIKMCHFD